MKSAELLTVRKNTSVVASLAHLHVYETCLGLETAERKSRDVHTSIRAGPTIMTDGAFITSGFATTIHESTEAD